MLKKRLGASVFVKDGLVVQSIKFKKYLPIGKPEIIIKNLDDWGVDEIILINIDSSNLNSPNYKLIQNVANLNIRTPLIYGGGVKTAKDAVNCIKNGADRVVINQIFFEGIQNISKMTDLIGKESLVLSLNLLFKKKQLSIFNYKTKTINPIDFKLIDFIYQNLISEIYLTDYINEGIHNGFNFNILKHGFFKNKKVLVYGGINITTQLRRLFRYNNVSSVVLGNCLNYKESSIFNIKKKCKYGFRK